MYQGPTPHRPKFGWISKAAVAGSGDEVFDRRLLAALADLGVSPDPLSLAPLPRWREAVNMLRGTPYYRARFQSAGARASARRVAARADVTVISWEPLDILAPGLPGTVVPLLHNVTSDALPRMYPESAAARHLARQALRWEQRLYGSGVPGVAVLSCHDEAVLNRIAPATPVCRIAPGLPPLAPDPVELRREVILSGTYDWRPKLRDVLAFGEGWRSTGIPVLYDAPLPEELTARLDSRPLPQDGTTLRYGVIPDRFVAGFKLKSTAYVASNAVVLSFCDILGEFEGLPDAALFVRHVRSARDILAAMTEIEAMDREDLLARFRAFKAACAARFTWTGAAERLLDFCYRVAPRAAAATGTSDHGGNGWPN